VARGQLEYFVVEAVVPVDTATTSTAKVAAVLAVGELYLQVVVVAAAVVVGLPLVVLMVYMKRVDMVRLPLVTAEVELEHLPQLELETLVKQALVDYLY
jgi:hypothetical protein